MSRTYIEAYSYNYNRLVDAVRDTTEEQQHWKPSPDAWSVAEVIAHLVDHSIVVSFRIRDILAGTTVQLPAFNQDAWVSGQRVNEAKLADLLSFYEASLAYNAQLLDRLTEADWDKSGINFKGDTVTIADIVRTFTSHVDTHLKQIERTKSALAAAAE
ncbi:DinB family protein [Paenibacillus sp. GCM10023252]|uniref:DinB family protein n=1 Tax=Paenibacillus sp. GCM10023252 TaxID=3252649 RepID=UPI0036179CDE